MERRKPKPSPYVLFGMLSAALVAGVAVFCAVRLEVPWLVAYLIAVSLCTFVCYGYDKAAARRRWLRIPERVLHLLAFLGGSLAAWLGQQTFRHKTVKGRFRVVFWLIVVLQAIGVAVWVRYS